MANKVTTVFSAETKDAVKGLKDIERGAEGAESAGKQLADALSKMADEIKVDTERTAAAADALGIALGPDMAAQIGRSGIEDMVLNMKKLGLTSEEIEADVDDLVVSIKKLDDVGRTLTGPKQGLDDVASSADRAKGSMQKLGGEADNSRSVMANMAGNSVQDLGQIAGAGSTAGMALGQMAEYASEGNIKLSGLAKVVGPMAAITVATMALAQGSKQAAARARELSEAYGELTAATDEQALATLGPMFLSAALDGKNLKDMFLEMADANIIGARRLLDLMHAQGMTVEQTKLLSGAIKEHDAAVVRSAEVTEKYGDKTDELTASTDKLGRTLSGVSAGGAAQFYDAVQATADAEQEATEETDRLTNHLAFLEGQWDSLTGKLNNEKALLNLKQQFADIKTEADDGGASLLDYKLGVVDFAKEVLKLPPEQVSKIIADIDQGKLDDVERKLEILARARAIEFMFEVRTKSGNGGMVPLAEGGIVKARPGGTPAIIGEAGVDEAVVPLDGQHGVGGTIHIDSLNVMLPIGTNFDQAVLNSITKLVKRNGPAVIPGSS